MNIALILSGGVGTRMGTDVPKQYIEVKGKPIIAYTMEKFELHELIDKIHIVAEPQWHDYILEYAKVKPIGFSKPGYNRQLSILNGLEDILKVALPDDNIIIHDAVRPFVNYQTITSIIKELEYYEAVMPILQIKDTLYQYDGKNIIGTLKRDRIVAGQAPEGFKLGKYYQATCSVLPHEIMMITGSFEIALKAGMDSKAISGDEDNFKITTMEELEKFRQYIEERK